MFHSQMLHDIRFYTTYYWQRFDGWDSIKNSFHSMNHPGSKSQEIKMCNLFTGPKCHWWWFIRNYTIVSQQITLCGLVFVVELMLRWKALNYTSWGKNSCQGKISWKKRREKIMITGSQVIRNDLKCATNKGIIIMICYGTSPSFLHCLFLSSPTLSLSLSYYS